VLDAVSSETGGKVADYIPELALADPGDLGIAVTSVLGRTYFAGDATAEFTIQSVSKPFVYALVLSDRGLDEVARHVGFEPSGEPFNAISLEEGTGRPANPMINAGAIVTSSLVDGSSSQARFERIRSALSAFAGRDLALDDRVYASELQTGDRNRALAYLARAGGSLPGSVEDAVDGYFRQCSLRVNAVDLSVMAATLANGGVNPVTKEAVIDEAVARITMSVMATCGMYDDSGEWMVRVGLPAKSGVGGGIVAVQSGEAGLGVYSPPLDARGNSVRGVAAIRRLSEVFRMHLFDHHDEPPSPIASSSRTGGGVDVRVRGELDFIAAEQLLHHVRDLAEPVASTGREPIHLYLDGVTTVRPAAVRLLLAFATELAGEGVDLTMVDPNGVLVVDDSPTTP